MQVFTLSWTNPAAAQAYFNLDTYAGACVEAGRAVQEITGTDSLNVAAACSGGQIAAAAVGHLVVRAARARRQPRAVRSRSTGPGRA